MILSFMLRISVSPNMKEIWNVCKLPWLSYDDVNIVLKTLLPFWLDPLYLGTTPQSWIPSSLIPETQKDLSEEISF